MSSVCRVCLVGNSRLHSVKNNMLHSLYEKLTNTKLNFEDARPRALCCFCYQKLLRCHTFSQMAVRSEKIFNHVYDMGLEITQDYINKVNLNMKQHLSVATMPFTSIDVNATNVDSQITIKDEPLLTEIDIKEEVTTELDKLIPEYSTKCQLTSEHDNSDEEKDVEEVLHKIPIEQTKQDHSKTLFINSKLISYVLNSHSQVKGNKYAFSKKPTETIIKLADETNLKLACRECDKQFKQKSSLVTHMRTHTGEKPFACQVCDKQFYQKSDLVRHIRIHTGEKLFACQVCDRQFNLKGNLVGHMRIHTGEKLFACQVCDRQFKTKGTLVRHMRIHTGEKLFACQVCDKQFYQKVNLVSHMRTHTGEKLFACQVCDKQYYQKVNLVSHMRTHTGE